MTAPSLGIIADDLSGAAECASHALVRVSRSIVVLAGRDADGTVVHPDGSRHGPPAATEDEPRAVVTVDTDSRRLRRRRGSGAVRAAAALVAGASVVVRRRSTRCLPRTRRRRGVPPWPRSCSARRWWPSPTRPWGGSCGGGVVHVGGTPLHAHRPVGRRGEARRPPGWRQALAPAARRCSCRTPRWSAVGVAAVWPRRWPAAAAGGLVAVCDAVTDADLDVVHAAAAAATRGPRAVARSSSARARWPTRPCAPYRQSSAAAPEWRAQRPTTRPFEGRGADTAGAMRSAPSVGSVRSRARRAGHARRGVARRSSGQVRAARTTRDGAAASRRRLLGRPRGPRWPLGLGRPRPRHGTVVVALDPAAPAEPDPGRAP